MAENKRFFYGWLILLTCILIMGLGYAPLVSCASLFTKPVTEDLGFTRSGYALVSTIAALMMAFYVAVHWKDHVKAVHAQSPGGVYDWKLSGVLLLFLCQHPAPVLRDSSLYRIF